MTGLAPLLGERVVATLFATFLHFLWQGALVAGVAGLGLWLLRGRGPEARYAWGASALAILVALPLVTAAWVSQPPTTDSSAPMLGATTTALELVAPPPELESGGDPARAGSAGPSPAIGAPGHGSLADRAAPWIVTLWLLGATALLAKTLGGWLLLRRRILRRAVPVERPWPDVMRRIAERLGIRRPVRLVRSDHARVPLVAGWLRPVIVMPASLLAGVPAGTIEAVLAHELAHVRRHDYLVNLLQIAAESALFFHPAVWWLSARIREEREHCCDDIAAGIVGERLDYARALAEVAGELSGRRLVAVSSGSLLARIRRLTGPDPRSPLPSAWAGVGLFAAIPLALAVGAWAPGQHAPTGPVDPPTDSAAATTDRDMNSRGTAPSELSPATGGLAERWERARREVGDTGGWIAWGVAGSSEGWTLASNTPGGPPDRADAPSTRDRLADAVEGTGSVLLFGFDPGDPTGDAVRHVRLRGPDKPLDLGGMPLHWLGNATDGESVALLERLLASTPDPAVRAEMAAALSLHGQGRLVVPSVTRLLDQEAAPEVRAEAIQWLDRHSGADVFALMRDALARDPSAEVRRAVTTSIDEPAVRDTFDVESTLLAAIFEDRDRGVREDALMALEDLPGDAAGDGVRRVAVEHPDAALRAQAVEALEDRPGEGHPELLERIAFEDVSREVRETAFHVLSDLDSGAAVAALRRIAREHPDPQMRSDAVAELADR